MKCTKSAIKKVEKFAPLIDDRIKGVLHSDGAEIFKDVVDELIESQIKERKKQKKKIAKKRLYSFSDYKMLSKMAELNARPETSDKFRLNIGGWLKYDVMKGTFYIIAHLGDRKKYRFDIGATVNIAHYQDNIFNVETNIVQFMYDDDKEEVIKFTDLVNSDSSD